MCGEPHDHEAACREEAESVREPAISRRHFLWTSGGGLGAIALAWLLDRDVRALDSQLGSPYAAKPPHFAPKARRVVQIFCPGGVSHVDTFDYKPDLEKHDGQELTGKGKIDPFFGKPGHLMKSRFKFARHGECGRYVSDLLPHIGGTVDDIAFIHSMVARSNNHTPAAFQLNSGFTMNGFPNMGAWISYGLGSENEDLPAFIVLPDPRGLPAGGSINWTSGFLAATHQGVAFNTSAGSGPLPDLASPDSVKPAARRDSLELLQRMNREYADAHPGDSSLAARVRSYVLAAKMQVSVPQLAEFSGESEATRHLYGMDREETRDFGRNCLLARRLLERGVRFVQLWNGGAFGKVNGHRINWDAHEDVVSNHRRQASTMDRPVAGLIQDLKQRGMLTDTLVVWSTEFGRTPITQGIGSKGRDHHQHAFTCFLAGAGIKPGISHGASDEVGYFAAENPVTIYDFHATILHLLGLDHQKLTYYHNGIERRLTDVHGHVVRELLA